ncbi:MAG: chorismate mutase [Candidatus Riflebacteria bacterium]
MTQNQLEELRKTIDGIDEQIVGLLMERTSLAQEIARAKTQTGEPVLVPGREIQIIDKLSKIAGNRLSREEVARVFLQIFSISRARQKAGKFCVFGEKNGWAEDAALARFGLSAPLAAVDNFEDFLAQIDGGNPGFACVTPQFSPDGSALLESLLSGKIAVAEKFYFSPEFVLVSNTARDLSEVHELCVTNEMLRLLRGFFLSISYDLKIKICRSASEVYENLQSVNPTAAVLPVNLLKTRPDLIVIREGLKSELIGPAKFMTFSRQPNLSLEPELLTTILCGIGNDNSKILELVDIIKMFNLNVFDIQTNDFEGKPWQKIVSIEISLPPSNDLLNQMVRALEHKCLMVKLCGFYSRFSL